MPNSDHSQVDYLRKRAHILRCGLHQRFEEITVGDFPANTPQLVIRLFQDILEKLAPKIEKSSSPKELVLICSLIEHYGSFLQFVDNAHTHQTPRALVQILEEVTEALNNKAKLLCWPQYNLNYSIVDILPHLQQTTENIFSTAENSSLFQGFLGPLNLISFPRAERDNILVHAVFGHEIGHPIADEYLSQEQWNDVYKNQLEEISEIIQKEYGEKLNQLSHDMARLKYKNDIIKEIIKIRERALQEFISDAVAILIFGPSALFALYDILVVGDIDYPPYRSEYYPPSRMRIRLMLKWLEQSGHLDAIKNLGNAKINREITDALDGFLEHLDKIAVEHTDELQIKRQPILKISYDWVEKTLEQAVLFAKKKVSKVIYKPDTVLSEIPELIDRVNLDLPPNEIGIYPNVVSVNWRSAILASWIYKIGGIRYRDVSTVKLQSSDYERQQKCTLRAIEYIVLQNRYNVFTNN